MTISLPDSNSDRIYSVTMNPNLIRTFFSTQLAALVRLRPDSGAPWHLCRVSTVSKPLLFWINGNRHHTGLSAKSVNSLSRVRKFTADKRNTSTARHLRARHNWWPEFPRVDYGNLHTYRAKSLWRVFSLLLQWLICVKYQSFPSPIVKNEIRKTKQKTPKHFGSCSDSCLCMQGRFRGLAAETPAVHKRAVHITVTSQWARWCLDCSLNHLFRCRSKKTSKLLVTGLCEGNPPVSGGFPSQRVINAKNDVIT